MSDSYQAIYDAVRSKISGGNIADAVADVARSAFDISFLLPHAQQEIYAVSHEMQRPSVLFRPRIFPDGNEWCCLLGDNLAEGVSGFGETPDAAAKAFDQAFYHSKAPPELKRTRLSGDGSKDGSNG